MTLTPQMDTVCNLGSLMFKACGNLEMAQLLKGAFILGKTAAWNNAAK